MKRMIEVIKNSKETNQLLEVTQERDSLKKQLDSSTRQYEEKVVLEKKEKPSYFWFVSSKQLSAIKIGMNDISIKYETLLKQSQESKKSEHQNSPKTSSSEHQFEQTPQTTELSRLEQIILEKVTLDSENFSLNKKIHSRMTKSSIWRWRLRNTRTKLHLATKSIHQN